jgi:hypothetical protein
MVQASSVEAIAALLDAYYGVVPLDPASRAAIGKTLVTELNFAWLVGGCMRVMGALCQASSLPVCTVCAAMCEQSNKCWDSGTVQIVGPWLWHGWSPGGCRSVPNCLSLLPPSPQHTHPLIPTTWIPV